MRRHVAVVAGDAVEDFLFVSQRASNVTTFGWLPKEDVLESESPGQCYGATLTAKVLERVSADQIELREVKVEQAWLVAEISREIRTQSLEGVSEVEVLHVAFEGAEESKLP